jgi:hypothetical protein
LSIYVISLFALVILDHKYKIRNLPKCNYVPTSVGVVQRANHLLPVLGFGSDRIPRHSFSFLYVYPSRVCLGLPYYPKFKVSGVSNVLVPVHLLNEQYSTILSFFSYNFLFNTVLLCLWGPK